MHQGQRVVLIEAYFALHGFEKGVDYNDVYIDDEGAVRVSFPRFWVDNSRRDAVLFGAFVTAGECVDSPMAFDEWKRGES